MAIQFNLGVYTNQATYLLNVGHHLKGRHGEGLETRDPRVFLEKMKGIASETPDHIYRLAIEKAGELRPLVPIIARESDRELILRSIEALSDGGPKKRAPLREMVTLLRAYGILPIREKNAESHATLVRDAIINPSVRNIRRLQYEGAVRFLEASQRFEGFEKRQDIVAGVLIALESWLPLAAEDMSDTLWNQAIDIQDSMVSAQKLIHQGYIDEAVDDITLDESVRRHETKKGPVFERDARSHFAVALVPFIRSKRPVFPPLGSDQPQVEAMFNGYTRVVRGDWGAVPLVKRAISERVVVKREKDPAQQMHENLITAMRTAADTLPLNDAGFNEFRVLVQAFHDDLDDTLSKNGLALHGSREVYREAAFQMAEDCFAALMRGEEFNRVTTMGGLIRGYMIDLFGVAHFRPDESRGESWSQFLQRISTTPMNPNVRPGRIATTVQPNDGGVLPPDVLPIDPIDASDPEIPVEVGEEVRTNPTGRNE